MTYKNLHAFYNAIPKKEEKIKIRDRFINQTGINLQTFYVWLSYAKKKPDKNLRKAYADIFLNILSESHPDIIPGSMQLQTA